MIFSRKKILVAGDLMLDVYALGEVRRISPEAPVPVLCVKEERELPGGAGNAILNLISLGMDVIAVGRVGEDRSGSALMHALRKEGVDTTGIIIEPGFQTSVKKRLIAASQQLLRLDYENTEPMHSAGEKHLRSLLPSLLEGVAIVAISDYAKGVLTRPLLSRLITMAKERAIPVLVDPKGVDFTKYAGATLIKPNQAEAYAASGLEERESLDIVAQRILEKAAIEKLMVTRGAAGISLFSKEEKRRDFPPRHVHEVKDVTGAGDTVLAVIAAALASGLALDEAASLANSAAGIAVERLGCVRITSQELEAHMCARF